jgi:hypothetical protein
MGFLYTVEFENVTVTAAGTDQDYFSILPNAGRPCLLHAVYLSQSSETGDAAEEILRIKIIRGHTTVGSGGTSATPQKLDADAPTALATARVNDTTIASVGTPVDLHADAWNVRAGWIYIPTPEMRIRWENANYLVVRQMSTVADDISMSGTLYYEEL